MYALKPLLCSVTNNSDVNRRASFLPPSLPLPSVIFAIFSLSIFPTSFPLPLPLLPPSLPEQVSFGRDFEQQLGFYVEARANFTNLDQVLIFLIHVSCILQTVKNT